MDKNQEKAAKSRASGEKKIANKKWMKVVGKGAGKGSTERAREPERKSK